MNTDEESGRESGRESTRDGHHEAEGSQAKAGIESRISFPSLVVIHTVCCHRSGRDTDTVQLG